MKEAVILATQDIDLSDQGVIVVRYDDKSVAIAVSLKSYGDIGAAIPKAEAKKLKDVLREAVRDVRHETGSPMIEHAGGITTRDLISSDEVHFGIRYNAENVFIFLCLTSNGDIDLVITKEEASKFIAALGEATS